MEEDMIPHDRIHTACPPLDIRTVSENCREPPGIELSHGWFLSGVHGSEVQRRSVLVEHAR
jgi:hypothetical protein